VTSGILDVTRPGAAPQQYKLVGNIGDTVSQESHASWSPDGTRVVFQSTRGTTADPTAKDSDIYIVNVPATLNSTTTFSDPIRLTTNPGDDVEPSIGPVRAESRIARPNGQLVYASNRNDFTFERDETYRFDGQTYQFGEDYDIYLQDVSIENTTTNRSQRIVNTPRQASLVLGGTGDIQTDFIDQNGTFPTDGKPDDDNYSVDIAVRGDDRQPMVTADGTQVVFCSDSNFGDGTGFAPQTKNNNPDDDFDIVRVDINSRNFTRLTSDRPVRNYIGVPLGTDYGTLSVNEDYEPSVGAVVDTAVIGLTAPSSTVASTATHNDRQRFMSLLNQ